MTIVVAKAISVNPAWAWLIVNGQKPLENRSWKCKHRGLTLIHASSRLTRSEYSDVQNFLHNLASITKTTEIKIPSFHDLEKGGVVGCVDVVDCLSIHDQPYSPWYMGQFAYILENAKPLPFFPCKGRLSFFTQEVPDDYLQPLLDGVNDEKL